MGVRGLTSYIAKHAELYLKPYELHDCGLVIDGDNLACNLYKDVSGTYSAFGGDYDDFYRSVVQFFHVLAECNITPYVLMDGGYEKRKLRTVTTRLRGKISIIKRINPCGSVTVFPVMMKEVFVDAVRDCGIPIMRCIFEADNELAALSRKLNCPVLSYDSDFYIYNVKYIPLITLTIKAHTKLVKEHDSKKECEKLRKNEVKHFEKNTKAQKIIGKIEMNKIEKRAPKYGKTYKYMDCCIYGIKNLIHRGNISKEKIPLFAVLLGNDYISRSSFRNFFAAGLGKLGRCKKTKQQQRRIRVILKWLQTESSESALEKILSHLKKCQRESLLAQVNSAICGYSSETCRSYDFFLANYENVINGCTINGDGESTDEESDQDYVEDGENFSDDGNDSGNEELENGNDSESNADGCNENVAHPVDDSENIEETESDEEKDDVNDESNLFADWFLEKLHSAHLPRYCVDLIHLKKYINSPQIEHFPYNDCNEPAMPILKYIFTLLHSAIDTESTDVEQLLEIPVEFTYMTRTTRVTNIQYMKYMKGENPKIAFNPRNPNPLLFRSIFEENFHGRVNVDNLFQLVNVLPNDLQLYFLAIVFWLQSSVHCDLIHLNALIISLIVLRTIDSKIPAERDLKDFQKRFGKIIKKERLVRDKEVLDGIKRDVKDSLKMLPVPEQIEYIPKSDCYLVMNNLLKHFHMQEIFKKKYDSYSSAVLHGFAEFQSVVFHLNSLNSLLGSAYESCHMGQLYCGVFLYNMYDLLNGRLDVQYYVKNFVFQDSCMMYNFYIYLLDWCQLFTPYWQEQKSEVVKQSISKKVLKKRRQTARKEAQRALKQTTHNSNVGEISNNDDDEFFDINNKFSTFLKIS